MNGGNYVSLMTVHVAKGLEFDNVFIVGLAEGSFPSYRAQMEKGNDGLEEERRLAYVAITRTKKKLFLTCNSGYTYTTDSRATPSSFFAEAGIKLPDRTAFGGGFYNGYPPRKKNDSWRTVGFGNRGKTFFSDGDAIDPFEDSKPAMDEPPQSADNGVTDWRVGDKLSHEKFGTGQVVEVISESIIVVLFDSGSKKTLLSTHPMITRIVRPGAEA